MAKLRPISARKVVAILEANGFVRIRQRSSHIVMQKDDERTGTVTVIVPNHRELRIGTLKSIIRQSRLPQAAFESG